MADVPEAYLGVWRRLLLRTPQFEDTTTEVYWLQTRDWHGDIRVPLNRPACAGKTSLAQLDRDELLGLSKQQGFAGVTEVVGDICRWHRKVDFQPPSGFNDIGRMEFESTERMLEYGIEQDYFEIWQRLPDSVGNPCSEIRYTGDNSADQTPSMIEIGSGKYFIRIKPRKLSLPFDDSPADIDALRCRVDFEITFGMRTDAGTGRILRSTFPWREGPSSDNYDVLEASPARL